MSTTELASPEKKDIREFFDAIAGRYDFLNSFLSFRLDHLWRQKACRILLPGSGSAILDLGTGTGKYLELFLKSKSWDRAVGLDFSEEMLKVARLNLPPDVELMSADWHELPFQEKSFDLIISSFTLRSVKDMNRFLTGVYRVLKKGGRASFLCLTRPQNPFYKAVYYPYLKYYLPLAGKLVSGHDKAYRFLAESIQHFQEPAETMRDMAACGFSNIQKYSFTMGAATLLVGSK